MREARKSKAEKNQQIYYYFCTYFILMIFFHNTVSYSMDFGKKSFSIFSPYWNYSYAYLY